VCEITNADIFNLFRNRRGTLLRRRSRSIVWPGRAPATAPTIPFKSYDDTVRIILRDSDAANRHVENYLNELNSQRGVGVVVQHELREGRLPQDGGTTTEGRRIPDGERGTPGREQHDVRPVDNERIRKAMFTRWAACENSKCDWLFRSGCMDRQRAGECSTLRGCNLRFNSRGHASVGG